MNVERSFPTFVLIGRSVSSEVLWPSIYLVHTSTKCHAWPLYGRGPVIPHAPLVIRGSGGVWKEDAICISSSARTIFVECL